MTWAATSAARAKASSSAAGVVNSRSSSATERTSRMLRS
jgi:hypothetical protein